MRTGRILLAVSTLCVCGPAEAATIAKNGTFAGVTVYYKVVVPPGYDPAHAYPTVLAFPWGSQDMRAVDLKLAGNWRAEAERRGYIIVSPAAPGGRLFFEEGARVFPAFIDQILRDYKVQGGKLHVAGASNGGLSAFHIAALYPQYFVSVTGYPGFLPEPSPAAIDALEPLCLYMYVGEHDRGWLAEMEKQSEQFRRKGFRVRYTVEKDQPHGIKTLEGPGATRLFDNLDSAIKGCN